MALFGSRNDFQHALNNKKPVEAYLRPVVQQ
jgi:hypothetical protein